MGGDNCTFIIRCKAINSETVFVIGVLHWILYRKLESGRVGVPVIIIQGVNITLYCGRVNYTWLCHAVMYTQVAAM